MENVKNQLVPPWVICQRLKNLKWRMGKMMMQLHEGEDPKKRGQIKYATHIYKIATLPLRITKIPLLGLKYWPIH